MVAQTIHNTERASIFHQRKAATAYAEWHILKHNGDFSAAANFNTMIGGIIGEQAEQAKEQAKRRRVDECQDTTVALVGDKKTLCRCCWQRVSHDARNCPTRADRAISRHKFLQLRLKCHFTNRFAPHNNSNVSYACNHNILLVYVQHFNKASSNIKGKVCK